MANAELGAAAARRMALGAIACLICLAAFSAPSSALTMKAVTVARMLEKAELILEGEITASEARAVEGSRMIVTCVEVEIAEILKGQYPEDSLELCFLGGTLDGVTMHVAEMRYPEVGETGFYFVESPGHRQVHPLYGGSQGHFLIERDPDSGEERVLASNRKPVVGLEAAGSDEAPGLSRGVARGVATAAAPGLDKAMSKRSFKQGLLAMLEASGE